MPLLDRLSQPKPLFAVGVYDALTALLAEQAGFEAAFVSGSALAYSQLARPDIGLITLTETALAVERIRERVGLYLLVDADSGFGNAFNVARTVRTLERAGANGIQIEDQENTKRPRNVTTRPVISTKRMVGKIKAALDARQSDQTIISARTDAAFSLGVESALERADAALDAGVDMVFVEGLTKTEDIQRLASLCENRAPLLYNLLEQNTLKASDLEHLGVSMILYPSVIINSAATAARTALQDLTKDLGISNNDRHKTKTIAEIIEAKAYLEKGYSFDA